MASQCRFDWFQMSRTVTLTVYAKNVLPDNADVRCNGVFLSVSLLYDGGKMHFERDFNLYGVSKGFAMVKFYQHCSNWIKLFL